MRLSLALEAALWIAAMGWLLFLGWHGWSTFKSTGIMPWRDLFEIALLAMLVWWPMIRVRIRYGYWMRDWDDAPTAPAPPQHPRQHRFLERE